MFWSVGCNLKMTIDKGGVSFALWYANSRLEILDISSIVDTFLSKCEKPISCWSEDEQPVSLFLRVSVSIASSSKSLIAKTRAQSTNSKIAFARVFDSSPRTLWQEIYLLAIKLCIDNYIACWMIMVLCQDKYFKMLEPNVQYWRWSHISGNLWCQSCGKKDCFRLWSVLDKKIISCDNYWSSDLPRTCNQEAIKLYFNIEATSGVTSIN